MTTWQRLWYGTTDTIIFVAAYIYVYYSHKGLIDAAWQWATQ